MIKKPIFLLILLVLIFTGINFWLIKPLPTNTVVGNRFDSPDETADYFWAKNFVETGQLKIAEPLNSAAKNQIHPRSFNVTDDGTLVPGVFLGLIVLYAAFAKLLGSWVIIYLTPVFAVFGVLAFYGIIKKIFGQKIALLSAILLIIHPVWWYYSVVSMYPNVTLISLVLIGIYFLSSTGRRHYLNLILGGLSIALALAIRPSEIVWVLFVAGVAFFASQKKINVLKVVVPLVIIGGAMLLMLFANQQIYGSWSASGYSQLQSDSSTTCQFCQTTSSLFLPFGFHPKLALHNFWLYFVKSFWWLAVFGVIGLIVFLVKFKSAKPAQLVYIATGAVVGIFLTIFYGSLVYFDVAIQRLDTIGLSYVRYWLPLFILVIPFTALGLVGLAQRIGRKWHFYIVIILVILFLYQSINAVLYFGPDSILAMRQRIADYKKMAAVVNAATPSDSVVVTVRQDKIFFPDRKVIHTFSALNENQELVGILPAVVSAASVYYFSPRVVKNLNITDQLKLENIKTINDGVLYQINEAAGR